MPRRRNGTRKYYSSRFHLSFLIATSFFLTHFTRSLPTLTVFLHPLLSSTFSHQFLFCHFFRSSGCVLQCYAYIRLLSLGIETREAQLSIYISCLAAGFTSALLAFDYDCDPKRRKGAPQFYGYIPDKTSRRAIVFLCLFLNSSIMLMIRSLGAAALMTVNYTYFVYYMIIDMVVYLSYKFVRNDLYYWVPLQGFPGVLMSLTCRVAVKFITDFTSSAHYRHSYELGGAYWTFNLILAIVASFASSEIYMRSMGENAVADREYAFRILGGKKQLSISCISVATWRTCWQKERCLSRKNCLAIAAPSLLCSRRLPSFPHSFIPYSFFPPVFLTLHSRPSQMCCCPVHSRCSPL